MGKRTLMLFRYGPIYRENIYLKMDSSFDLDFVFLDKSEVNIKKMDYSKLTRCNFIGEDKVGKYFNWMSDFNQVGIKKYDNIFISGSIRDLTEWRILIINRIFKRHRILMWSHGWYGRESKLKILLKKIFFSMADDILLYGNYAKNLMIENGINESKLKVIYNSLDYDTQVAIRSNLKPSNLYQNHFGNNYHNLIFIGRLTFSKRLDLLIDAINHLKESKLNLNIIFIGDGEAKHDLESLVSKNNLAQRVWFYGETFNEEEISELIFNADLCISPGNVGLTAMHSLVYGTPVITHNDFTNQGPEFEAITNGITGSFFIKDSVESLSDEISKWFNSDIDRNTTRIECYKVIDEKYNPYYQLNLLKDIL